MNIIVFGMGEMGTKLIEAIIKYAKSIHIVAVCDNHSKPILYKDIPFISPEDIRGIEYDQIWITTVYFESIMDQLEALGVDNSKVRYVESIAPVLEERIRENLAQGKKEAIFTDAIDEKILYYIRSNAIKMYPYSFYDEYLFNKPDIFYDEDASLYYGIYKEKRMYLSSQFNTEEKARAYFNYVIMEQDIRSPHCYWNFDRINNVEGCVVDVGAAEGIFGLRLIDNISHLYMVEADTKWIEALRWTYRDYADKVTIIQKFADNYDGNNSVRLDTVLEHNHAELIKIDIEGMEMKALEGLERVVKEDKPVMAICTYHHREDNDRISKWLEQRKYSYKNSEGYVMCTGEWELERDEAGFRRALVYAW